MRHAPRRVVVVYVLVAGGRRVCRRVRGVVLYPVVLWYWAVNRGAREASLEYLQRLQQATGGLGHEPGRRDTLRHFFSFAETILDKMLAVGGRYRFDRIRFVGREAIDRMVREKQG